MLGRSHLDGPDVGEDEAPAPNLCSTRTQLPTGRVRSDRDKGADKGAEGGRRPTKRPDLNSDRAENGEFGTAYRIRTGDLRLERAVS